jgi:hypothetical protein
MRESFAQNEFDLQKMITDGVFCVKTMTVRRLPRLCPGIYRRPRGSRPTRFGFCAEADGYDAAGFRLAPE